MFQSFKQRHNNFEQSVNPTLNELQELTSRFSYSATLYKTCYRTQLKQQKYSHVQCTSQELHHVNPSWSWMYNTLEYQLRDGLSEACQPQSDLTSLLIPIFTGMRRSNFKSHFWCYAMWSTVQICEDDYTRWEPSSLLPLKLFLPYLLYRWLFRWSAMQRFLIYQFFVQLYFIRIVICNHGDWGWRIFLGKTDF